MHRFPHARLTVLAVALWPAVLAAQPVSVEPPLTNRPPQFSGMVGSYTITAIAEPTAVRVEEPITLRVVIKGKGPAKYQPSRKLLKLFPEAWAHDFYIEPVPTEDRAQPAAGIWEFVYRLRPKNADVTAADGIKLVSYEPPAGGKPGRYQTSYAEEIAIKVLPRAAAPAVAENLPVRTAPPSFYELPPADRILASWPAAVSWPGWLLLALLIAPPLVTVAGVVGWRQLFPDAGRARRAVHSMAARRALQALGRPDEEPPWVVFGRYLRERLDFQAEEPTPAEAQRFLRKRGASRAVAEKLAAFLGRCDAARFAGPSNGAATALRDEGARLIGAVEDDLCAS